MFKNPFSFEGRIRRTEYGLSHIIGTFCFVICIFFIEFISQGSSNGVTMFILYIPFFWFLWAQGAKRCHDIGKSGWWQLVPLYGIWMLFEDGKPGFNEYGINPKDAKINAIQKSTDINSI